MKCSFCGTEVAEGSSRCPVCGIPLDSENTFSNHRPGTASAVSNGQLRCTACGATLPPGSKFCTRCGHSLAGPSQEEQSRMQQQKADFWNEVETKAQEQKKKHRQSTRISWLLRLAGLIAAAFLIYYIAT